MFFDLYGEKLKVVATGSGSFDVKANVEKYLVGRAVYFELMPLTFEEFLLWKNRKLYEVFEKYLSSFQEFVSFGHLPTKPVFEKTFYSLLEEYVIYGGFPAIVKENDIETKKDTAEKSGNYFHGKRCRIFLWSKTARKV